MLKTLVRLSGYVCVAGALVLTGCGGSEDPETKVPASDELAPLHHNSPVYEQVDDLVSDQHNEAIEEVLDRMDDIDENQAMDGDQAETSETGDSATETTMTGDGPSYDEDFMVEPDDNAQESYDSVEEMLDANTPEETQDGTVDGVVNQTRIGEDEVGM